MPNTLDSALRNKPSLTTEKGFGRAQEILHAARALLAAEGFAGMSMRRVAGEVGITLSNLQHYYQSKDALLEAVLLYTMSVFQDKIDAISAAMDSASRIERFLSTIDMFLDELADPVTHAIFFELWALASRNAFASRLMDMMLARERKAIFNLIRGLSADISDDDYMRRAVLMVAQVEGLMLFRLNRDARRAECEPVRAEVRKVLLALATVP